MSFSSSAAGSLVREIGEAVKDVTQLQPRIVESTTVVVEGSRQTFELALLDRSQLTEYRYESTWAGSRKTLHVKAHFHIKAGYKLADGRWFVKIAPDGSGFQVAMPPATVLSCEQSDFQVLEDVDGWWNKLSKEERSMVVNRLKEKALQEANQGTFLQETEEALLHRLEESARRRQIKGPVGIHSPPVS